MLEVKVGDVLNSKFHEYSIKVLDIYECGVKSENMSRKEFSCCCECPGYLKVYRSDVDDVEKGFCLGRRFSDKDYRIPWRGDIWSKRIKRMKNVKD